MQHTNAKADGGEVEMATRGVYWARYLREGKPIAYCVTSDGNVLRRYVLQHPSRAEMAVAELWDILDKSDPTPEGRRAQLRLVLPTTEHRSMIEVLDPYAMPALPGRWPLRPL